MKVLSNVLQRFKNCAAGLSDNINNRLTADNLVIGDTLIKKCIKNHLKQKSQYHVDSIKIMFHTVFHWII